MKKIYVYLLPLLITGCASLVETPEQMLQRISRQSEEQAAKAILSDPSPENRAQAAAELGRKADAASVELLRKALADPEARVRAAAAGALRESGETGKAAQADMLELWARETDPSAAVAMGWTLKRWGADLHSGLETLRAVMAQKENLWARYNAALIASPLVGVEEIAPIYVDTLGTTVAREARNKPEDLIAEFIAEHAGVLLPLLAAGAENENPSARAAIARLLYKFKPKVDPMEVVRRRMEDPEADIFNTVLPPQAETTLLALLADPEAEVRAAAAWSAGMCMPAPLATVPLLQQLLNDENERVRVEAVMSIGAVSVAPGGPVESLDLMAQRLTDSSSRVRRDTALALGNVGPLPENITRKLMERLDPYVEVDANVRANAAMALGNGADVPELREALVRGVADPDSTVAERSQESLRRLEQ